MTMNMKKRSFGEESTVANVLMLLSRGGGGDEYTRNMISTSTTPNRSFECKTCNKRFSSFQALGGHRASHKKPKLTSVDDDDDDGRAAATTAKPKVHECSVCGLEFAIGQALGGHMRRHRTSAAAAAEGTLMGAGHGFVEKKSTSSTKGKRVTLDLNLPPLEEATEEYHCKLELGLGLNFCR